MEKKHTEPSLEHSRLTIQERIERIKGDINFYSLCDLDNSGLGYLNTITKELAGHEQALKVLDNHYLLLEALKGMIDQFYVITDSRNEVAQEEALKKAQEAINNL